MRRATFGPMLALLCIGPAPALLFAQSPTLTAQMLRPTALITSASPASEDTSKAPPAKPESDHKRAAALFEWSLGKEPTKQNGEEDEEEQDKPIETDRPDFTEASSTVGQGRIQLEMGYTFIRDRDNGQRNHSHSYPEALLRIGLFADWFELRLGQNFSNTRNLLIATSEVEGQDGAEDLYLGVKLALTEQKRYLPETALILQTTLPTGSADLTARELLPGINYLFGWDIIEDCLSAGGSLQANRTLDGVDHYYVEVAQSLTLGYRLTQRLGAYTEWFAFFPCGSLDPEVGPEHYFDGGFTFLVNNDFQLDVRAGVGLNRHADDYFVGTGLALRY